MKTSDSVRRGASIAALVWLARGGVLLVVTAVASVWADGLLHITDNATQMVLAASDLQAMCPAAEAAREPGDPVQSDTPAPDANQPPTPTRSVSEDQPPPRSVSEDLTPTRSVSEDLIPTRSASEDSTSLSQVLTPPQAASEPLTPPDTIDELAPPPADVPAIPAVSSGGSLIAFGGAGVTSTAGDGDSPGAGRGPVWDVDFATPLTLQLALQIQNTRLVLYRARRGGGEVAVTDGRTVRPAVGVDAFLEAHPQFSDRRGIVLDRSLFFEIEDQLVSRGGGWRMWLLVDDQTFRRWGDDVLRETDRRQLSWDRVRRIAVRLDTDRTDQQVVLNARIVDIQGDEPGPLPGGQLVDATNVDHPSATSNRSQSE